MERVAERIIRIILRYRRTTTCTGDTCAECERYYSNKLEYFISRRRPIQFVLPAFPTKSPNRAKTLGPLPDMAEEVALCFLHELCSQIESVYAPGAHIIIAADGRVFSDLIRVSDRDVTAYQRALGELIDHIGATSLTLCNLEDVLDASGFADMRRRLVAEYGASLEELRAQVRADSSMLALYRGITRFLFEDARGQRCGMSNTALQKESRQRAYRVIRRSRAWNALVTKRYPRAVRLSIHPQTCASPKLGIHLAATRDQWMTPWHGVILATPGGFLLMKRWEAEAMGAQLVHVGGRPSHFVSSRVLSWEDSAILGPNPHRRQQDTGRPRRSRRPAAPVAV